MALDRQRILGELGSVMKQLQNADCGCLGKLFGNPQQAAQPMMGSPLPTCGGCRRACCHGHGCGQYNTAIPMNQAAPNMNYTSMEGSNASQQPMSGNMHGFGPQIVNMMRGNHMQSQNIPGQTQEQMPVQMQGQMQGQIPGQLTGPMVIDAPQSPHGKVGLTPFTPPSMVQQFNPAHTNQGDVAGNMQYKSVAQPNIDTNAGNIANTNPWLQQNTVSNPVAQQIQSPYSNNIAGWPQQNTVSNPISQQTPLTHSSPHGQHSQGIAQFNQMFPGIKQGLGGNLGFDPMAIAIQMNPDNHLQSAMKSMHTIMNDNKGIDQMLGKPPAPLQQPVAGNIMQQNSPAINRMMQQSPVSEQIAQGNVNHTGNVIPIAANEASDQVTSNQQNAYGQQIPQQNQQIYAATLNPNLNQQEQYENKQQLPDQEQYQQQQIKDFNSGAPNLPVVYEGIAEDSKLEALPPEPTGYPNQLRAQQILKEPIFPVDTSKNITYMPTKNQNNNNYGYNTLGQPVEMLPAKMYHPPEPSLPQTLSPQPVPVKPKTNLLPNVNVKATVSKTSLMGNKPIGKTPSRSQLQRIYNQYKGSQSFTNQNVRRTGEGTCSDNRLNVPQPTKLPAVPVERVGGDTIVTNPPSDERRMNKVEQVMGQIGDVAAAKPGGDTLPIKDSVTPVRKCRNGLQDMVFSSYPTSAAWTFHGSRRNERSPTHHYQNRRY